MIPCPMMSPPLVNSPSPTPPQGGLASGGPGGASQSAGGREGIDGR